MIDDDRTVREVSPPMSRATQARMDHDLVLRALQVAIRRPATNPGYPDEATASARLREFLVRLMRGGR